MRLRVRAILVIFALLGGCEGQTKQGELEQPAAPPPALPPQDPAPQPVPAQPNDEPAPFDNPASLAPLDQRPVVNAVVPPPAISGGTLLVSADGTRAVLSDPDRDRISIVDVPGLTLVANVDLEPGDEPGRLAEDASGRVHVVLRRAGMIASLDVAAASLLERRAVCAAPRGLTYDAQNDELLVACASGELARMPAQGGAARTVARLGTDLRDVALFGAQPVVTRFRSAELLRVDGETSLATASRPERSRALFGEPSTGALRADTMSPQVAYRLRVDAGGALLLSQLERDGEIDLRQAPPVPDPQQPPPMRPVITPYGGGGGPVAPIGIGSCSGVVQPLLSLLNADGTIVGSRRIPGTLVVDAARSSRGEVVVAQAGALDPERPIAQVGPPVDLAQNSELLLFAAPFAPPAETAVAPEVIPCAPATQAFDVSGQVTAVAFASDDLVLAQSREPAFLVVIARSLGTVAQVALDGASVADTGHALFSHNAGAGVACASCHAEGGDDGHTWRFSDMGLRRTQSLHVGLTGSAPFHWAGDEHDFSALLQDVMVGRMGGAPQTPERSAALEHWIYALQAPPSPRAVDDEAAQRGRLLFEGEAQCSTCHSGPRLSSNETKDVGKGEALQVPSLVAIAYRKPLMHDGCAADLRARFDPACGGGDAHGKTSQLSSAQVDDLVAYLETL